MTKITVRILFIVIFLSRQGAIYSQQKIFDRIDIPTIDESSHAAITGITEDQEGYIWFIIKYKGLYRYDGSQFLTYVHDPKDTASISGAALESIAVDSNDIIWIGSFGGGLDKFDPTTNKFTHFLHQQSDSESLANDTVTALLVDHQNNLWVGDHGGLDLYDRKTGYFTHHPSQLNDPTSLSCNDISYIYEDKSGVLWLGCGAPFPSKDFDTANGGLNRFDKATGKFTRYLHDPHDPNSIATNQVKAILEDTRGNFWVGSSGDGLQTLDRNTGKFTHYFYDPTHPENLSRGPLLPEMPIDYITFIKEDVRGNIWIGTLGANMYEYDPITKTLKHHGDYIKSLAPFTISETDTATGFTANYPWCAISGKEGVLWIGTCFYGAYLFKVNAFRTVKVPFTTLYHGVNIGGGETFFKDNNGTLWIGTIGLLRKNTRTGAEKTYRHDEYHSNSLTDDNVFAIVEDNLGKLWLGTGNGLDRFDPVKETFTHYRHDTAVASSLGDNTINVLRLDKEGHLWIGTNEEGLDKMAPVDGKFIHFKHSDKDSSSLSDNRVFQITDDNMYIWAATAKGLNKIMKSTGLISHYLLDDNVKCVAVDATGSVWAGTTGGLYLYNATANKFALFDNINIKLDNILYILEDDRQNLWISSAKSIFKIDSSRKNIRVFGIENGVEENAFLSSNDYKSKDGELFIGNQLGYYHFFPSDIEETVYPPIINITGLQVVGKDVTSGAGSIFTHNISKTNKISLAHDQNSFEVSFSALNFTTPGKERYLYMLDNYDNTWHDASALQKIYFFNLPFGRYVLRIRAINLDGVWAEKNLDIIISPPWWETWWAITILGLLLTGTIWGVIYFRSRLLLRENKALEEKVKRRTDQLQKSIEELKATQSQLVQSEKMASLGELTAGIAHEIQNPLNFITNFSELNKELLVELKDEIDKGNIAEVNSLADDIIANGEKINHHGKRADGIVKGMLQHSRSGTSSKEPTDINALADEYLRLSYHGLRAQDKRFNASINTDFDTSTGLIKVIPQDIGRVLLNLYNNAFYSISEKKKRQPEGYDPTIIVATKKVDNSLVVMVSDNGDGIPQKIIDKIFQPFFTTKPTGKGTGLGLSISYDIIKEHGGTIQLETKESEGTTFIIRLPII